MAWHDLAGRLSDPTPQEFGKWIRPRDGFGGALRGEVSAQLSKVLLQRLADGQLYAAASSVVWLEGDERRTRGLTAIDPSWWENPARPILYHDPLWRYGQVSLVVSERHSTADQTATFYDVRFEWDGFYEVVPRPEAVIAPQLASAPLPIESKDRGRPHRDFKGEALAEIAAQFATGELSASRQADIERAILDWVETTEKSLAESTAREWARPIWQAIERKADK